MPVFVIHEHHAKKLHWDLRLEKDGVLKSWAIPKTPQLKKGIKRLAIQVEDHPLSYKDFEGRIPEGSYGAGEVKIWDSGNYDVLSWDKNKIEVRFKGKKLSGNYILIKTKYLKNPDKSWLFFKI